MGADLRPGQPLPTNDPRFKELVDEIVNLSTEFGILTEYTAFIATEGSNLGNAYALDSIRKRVSRNLARRARLRSGAGSYNQEANLKAAKRQSVLNRTNNMVTADLRNVEFTTVQQVNDRTFYRRGNQWIDSRLINKAQQPDQVIRVGTKQYQDLAAKLARANRQGCIALQGEVIIQVENKTVLLPP